METETANSREKKQDIGRKKEIWRYVVTKRTRNTQHTQTGRQTSRSGGTSRQESEQNLDVLATVHERNIATFKKKVAVSPAFTPPPPTPQFQCWGVVSFLFPDPAPVLSQHWNWGSGGSVQFSIALKTLQYLFRVPWEIDLTESKVKSATLVYQSDQM